MDEDLELTMWELRETQQCLKEEMFPHRTEEARNPLEWQYVGRE